MITKEEQLSLIADDIASDMETSIENFYFATDCKESITRADIMEALTKRLINGDI